MTPTRPVSSSRFRSLAAVAAAGAVWLAAVGTASAVIPANIRVQKLFADAAWAGTVKVAAIRAERSVLQFDYGEAIKAKLPGGGEKLTLVLRDVPDAADFLKTLAVGQAGLVMVVHDSAGNVTGGLVHVGDRWLRIAPPAAGVKAWSAGRDVVLPSAFPGTTATLETVWRDLAAGKDLLLNDELDHKTPGLLKPVVIALPKLPVAPAVAGVTTTEGKAALYVEDAKGARGAFTLQDGAWAAVKLGDGATAKAGVPSAEERAAWVKGEDAGILPDGVVPMDGPWGKGALLVRAGALKLKTADGKDALPLTGIPTPKRGVSLIGVGRGDFNGDGRPDVMLLTDDGKDWVLLDRGYGCRLPHTQPPLWNRSEWKSADGKPLPAPVAAAFLDVDADGKPDVVFLAADGTAYALKSPWGK